RSRTIPGLCWCEPHSVTAARDFLRCLGRGIRTESSCRPPSMGPVAIQVSPTTLAARVRKTRRGNSATFFFLDVQLEIPPGITILFGPSGAGKSTLLDCIAGLAQPDAGRIAIDGKVFFDSERRLSVAAQQRQIAYVFQSLALFPHMTVE